MASTHRHSISAHASAIRTGQHRIVATACLPTQVLVPWVGLLSLQGLSGQVFLLLGLAGMSLEEEQAVGARHLRPSAEDLKCSQTGVLMVCKAEHIRMRLQVAGYCTLKSGEVRKTTYFSHKGLASECRIKWARMIEFLHPPDGAWSKKPHGSYFG